jgi:bacillaene synthase trans-acting acyltransferase
VGRDLLEQLNSFYKNALELDDLLRKHLGHPIVETIYNPRRKVSDLFNETTLTHPAIFLIEYALSKVLLSEGIKPDHVLATNMGAFAALALAKSLSVEQAAPAVIAQASLVDVHCAAGGMVTLPNINRQEAEVLAWGFGCELGSANRWAACIVAADQARLDCAECALRGDCCVAFQRLAVSRALHSRWIDAAQPPYLAFLTSLRVRQPRIPVVCCAEAKVLYHIPDLFLWDVNLRPSPCDDTIHALCSRAVRFQGRGGKIPASCPHFKFQITDPRHAVVGAMTCGGIFWAVNSTNLT